MSETEAKPAAKPRKPRAKKVAETVAAVENVEVAEAPAPADNVISSPQKAHTDGPVRSNTTATATGVIGSAAADRVFEKPAVVEEKKDDPTKIALWSNKNLRWTGVGAISKGYNIVNKEAAAKWLTKDGIREASPEEVASYYSK